MMRIIISCVLVIFVSPAVHTQTTLMKIKMKDGTTQSFDVTEITKITFGTITGVADPRQLAPLMKSFTLFQNYPNPFNPTTSISYAIPRGGLVDVGIYDVAGRRVKAYMMEYGAGGNYRVEWNGIADDGRPLASGLYFYNVKFENTIVSRKMLFLK
jgi:flagellar hook capping protein FlgD